MTRTNKYPKFDLRMDTELYDWLKDFSLSEGKPMATIIKEELQKLKRKEQLKTMQRLEAMQGYQSIYRDANPRNARSALH